MARASDIRAGGAFVELMLHDGAYVRGLRKASQRLARFSAAVTKAGRAMLSQAAVFAAPFVAATKVYADFETKMAAIATMLDDTSRHMGAFREGVRAMAVESGKSTDDLATSLYNILSAGIEASKGMDFLRASTRLAVAGQAEVTDATNVMLTLMEAYGKQLRDAGDASDFLFTIVRKGRTTLAELAPSLGRLLAIAERGGLSLEEMGAAMALLTRATGSTEQAVMALNAMVMTFIKPSDDAAKLWRDKFGSAFNYATLQAEGLTEVLRKLATLTTGEIGVIFPNIRALRGVLPALAKFEGFSDDLAAMADRAGKVTTAFDLMQQSMGQKLREALAQALDALLEIGNAIAPLVSKWLKGFRDVAMSVVAWVKEHQGLVVTVAKGIAIFAAAGATMMVFGGAIKIVSMALTALVIAAKGVAIVWGLLAAHPVFGMFAAGLVIGWALVRAFKALRGELTQYSTAMAAALAKGDQARQTETQQLRRLEDLAAKQKLTNDQMDNAAQIIATLESKYGDLGLELDRTTGKLTGVAGAQKAMNEQMREAADIDLTRAIEDAGRNIEHLTAQLQGLGGWSVKGMSQALGQMTRMYDMAGAGADLIAQIKSEQQRQRADLLRRGALRKRGGTAAITGEQPTGWGDVDTGEDNADRIKDYNERTLRELTRLAIESMEDEHKRRILLINERYRHEMKRAKELGADVGHVDAARRQAIHNEEEAHKRRLAEEAKRLEEEQADRRKQLQYENARLEIEASKKGLDKRLALIDLEEKRAIEAAKETGLAIEGVRHKHDLRRQIARQAAETPLRTAAKGTFNPWAVRGMGAGKAEERMAKDLATMKEQNKRLIEINQNQLRAFQRGMVYA